MDAFIIILTGCLVAIPCAVLGCYLVLRKMVMIGDAISHAVLPGIVIAYMITHSFDSVFMIAGAGLMGFITTFLVEFFHKKGRLQADASIGVTFTGLFAIGIILISVYGRDVDLDQDCVLYGELINIPLYSTPDAPLPGVTLLLLIVTAAVILFVIIGFKELWMTTFDSAYAAAVGISVSIWHYALMGMVSLTTVASFDAVGAILVVAFLVAPAATAYLLTDKLKVMLLLAAGIGIISVVGGYVISRYVLDTSTSAAMASFAGLLFTIALLFSPTQGVLTKRWRSQANPEFTEADNDFTERTTLIP